MTSAPEKIVQAALRIVPGPIERRLRTEAGTRFTRFVPVAVVAVITSQVMLGLLTGPVNMGGFAAGVIASMVAALVSYLLSRWAWERRGRPDLLRETLPFWLVSVAVWIILGLTSHFATSWAHSMGYTHWKKHLIVQGSYLLVNCLTFVARFLIFHYVLFADRDSKIAVAVAPDLATAEVVAAGEDTGPMATVSSDSSSSAPPPGH
jgi:putative flippase GtrA